VITFSTPEPFSSVILALSLQPFYDLENECNAAAMKALAIQATLSNYGSITYGYASRSMHHRLSANPSGASSIKREITYHQIPNHYK
jgi:hypothetical protein